MLNPLNQPQLFIAFSWSHLLTACLFLYELGSLLFKAVTGGYF